MRLWKNGAATAVWTGYQLEVAWYWIDALGKKAKDGRLWIDLAEKPSYKGY